MAADGQGRLALTGARKRRQPDSVWLIDTDGSVRLLMGPDDELAALPEGLDWPYLSGPSHVGFAPDGTVLFLESSGRSTLRAVDPVAWPLDSRARMNGYTGGVAGTSRRGRVLAGMLVVWLAALAAGCDLIGGEEVDWPPQVASGQMVHIKRGEEATVLAGDLGDVSARAMAADGQGRLALTGAWKRRQPDSVWLIDTDGSVRLLVGPHDELPALPEGLNWPYLSGAEHVAFAPDGTVLFLESPGRSTLRAVDPDSGEVRTVAGTGESSGVKPFEGEPGDPLATRLTTTSGLAVADDGRVFIADAPTVDGQRTARVWLLDPERSHIEELAGPDGRLGPLGGEEPRVALDGEVLWVLDAPAGVLTRIDLAAETVEEVALQGLPENRRLIYPVPAPDGGLFATGGSTEEYSLWHVSPQGVVHKLGTSEQLGSSPSGLATDGELLYVDARGLVVLRVTDLLADDG